MTETRESQKTEFDSSRTPFRVDWRSIPCERLLDEKYWGRANADRIVVHPNGFYVGDGADHHAGALVASNGGKLGYLRAFREQPMHYSQITERVADEILDAGFNYQQEIIRAYMDRQSDRIKSPRAMSAAAAVIAAVYYVEDGYPLMRVGQSGDARYDQVDTDGTVWGTTDQSFIHFAARHGTITEPQAIAFNELVEEHRRDLAHAIVMPNGQVIMPLSPDHIARLRQMGGVCADIFFNNRSFLDTSAADPRLAEPGRPDFEPRLTKVTFPVEKLKRAVASTDGLGDAVPRSQYIRDIYTAPSSQEAMRRILDSALAHDDDLSLVMLEPF